MLYTMLYSSLLRRAQGVLCTMLYSLLGYILVVYSLLGYILLVYSLHARCYNVSLTPLPPPLSCLQVALYRPELTIQAKVAKQSLQLL